MARNGFPDDPGDYPENEPTQYANYGGTGGQAYSEYGPPTGYQPAPTGYVEYQAPPTPPPAPWHQRPAVLVGLGVLTAALLALLVYAVVAFTNSSNSPAPAGTSSSVPATSDGPSTPSAAATSTAPQPVPTEQSTAQPSTSTAAPPSTVTITTTAPTTTTPTTTEAPTPSTTTSVSTSVTTVTETTTKHLFPTLPLRPTPREQAPAG